MRYEVIRYPTYWVVIDHAKHREIVSEHRTLRVARRECAQRNRVWASTLNQLARQIKEMS